MSVAFVQHCEGEKPEVRPTLSQGLFVRSQMRKEPNMYMRSNVKEGIFKNPPSRQ